MRFINITSSLLLVVLISCTPKTKSPSQKENIPETAPLIKIAFGSCAHQDYPQPFWADISQERADLWLWLGDNIYGDSEDMSVMQSKYEKQSAKEGYKAFLKTTRINGTWDDHDYGLNDGGKEYKAKDASQQLFLDFMGASSKDHRRTQKGIYTTDIIRKGDKEIKIIILDTRYFRDELIGERAKFKGDSKGTILGEEQWAWLEKELNSSTSDVHLIVSSIQVISEEHGWEKWGNFPHERNRLLDLISDNKIKNPIILSGDRHTAEISQITWKGQSIYDITASGMTHTVDPPRPETNKHRVDGTELIFEKHYGVLEIDIDGIIRGEIKTGYGRAVINTKLF